MDLQYKAFIEAYCLVGIVSTLRKLYQPPFEPCERITAALQALARRERLPAQAVQRPAQAIQRMVLAHAE